MTSRARDLDDDCHVTNVLPISESGIGIVFWGILVDSEAPGSVMRWKRGLWAACICFTLGVAVAVSVWSAKMQPPVEVAGEPAPAQLPISNKAEQPQAPLIAPHPHELPDGVILGKCWYLYEGGPPRPPDWPRPRPVPAWGMVVEVFEHVSNKKVAEPLSGKDGTFELHLHPGSYRLVTKHGLRRMDKDQEGVKVEPGKKVEVQLTEIFFVP
jgi:hypothetical protein